ncbi:MAG: alpha/beta hydrolase [Clostridia bacterium]|nr:alpha/beta hydrolase [Clostridia bacterium]
MSLKYEVLKQLVRWSGLKRMWVGKSTEELLENRRRQNAKNRIPALRDDAFDISLTEVMGFPVLKLIHKRKADRANLFLIGGGMISAPRPASVRKALRFAKETGLDLFIPYYPLCTDYPLTRAYEMIHETYKVMLRDYAPERISVLGTSSGGNLALGMVPYINDGHGDTPIPGYIMALSPGTCVSTEEEWQRMLALDKKDVAIPAQYMKTAVEIMRHGDSSVPDYMIWLQRGDFTGCPRVTFIYGSDETLYACAPSFEAAMKKYGVDYQMIVGEGMFHCYPVFPIVKEAREGWKLMVRLMKEATSNE